MKLSRIHWKKFESFLLEVGCKFVSEEGDHRKYYKEGLLRPIIIPREKSLPQFIILNNLRTLGISREEYLKIIQKNRDLPYTLYLNPIYANYRIEVQVGEMEDISEEEKRVKVVQAQEVFKTFAGFLKNKYFSS